ncbi:protoporphyrinogen oxidase [Desulfosediminicola sp.]|uniref:protoporphyrinogen oxidase n=1 Tax=Desulfosediminicola sp. TaxID=2886825 RepID=UPI003AF2D20E
MTTHFSTIIVGGGLSGLTVAHKLRQQDPEHKLLVLEKNDATGGVIRTHREKGFITEIGPHGFLDNCNESKDILRETGLDKEAVKAPLIEFVRYVYLRGKLQLIPQTPLKISMAPLIPWKDKFRAVSEIFRPPLAGEPTVAKWVDYRFGSAMLPYIDAVFTGTYAGDFDKLKIDAVMPGVRALEKEHGSVIKGVFAKMMANRKSGTKKKISMPAMTSFPTGMSRLPERLTEQLTEGKDLLLNCGVSAVAKTESGWQVETEQGVFTADTLVLATPTNVALKFLEGVSDTMPMTSIPETWIGTVVFGFGPGVTIPPGFGYLTPEVEKRFTLGSLFSSNMFPGRAPENHVVFETLIGGRRHPERLELPKEELVAKALADVKEILKIDQEPVYTTVLQSDGGIPQLEEGYPELLEWRDEVVRSNHGLHICGFGWEGIGLNDMMKAGTKVAKAIIDATDSTTSDAEVKKIYF